VQDTALAATARDLPAASLGCGAVILGADYRGLGLVRSLGRAGVPVWVLEDGDDHLATHSRFASRTLFFPEADEERVDLLLSLAHDSGLQGWTVFPTGDETAAFIARHHDRLSGSYILTTPAWKVLRWAYDKRLTHRLAVSLGIDSPRTWFPAEHGDPAAGVEFPAILKPAIKPGFNRLTAAKAWRVEDADELRVRYAEAARLMSADVLLVQELIPGSGDTQFSYAALCSEGRALATVVARRTRQYPSDFGRASTYVESVERPEIVEPSERLLAALRWEGLVEVEYKRDPRTQRFKLLDVNPRAWGWHTLGAAAGVDFPLLAWRLARGEAVPQRRALPGVRWVRLSTDLPTSLKEMLRGRLSVRDYLRSLRGPIEGAIFARDDPVPGLVELPLLAQVLVRRLARRSGV
jgi:D-aspartate ligase